MEKRYVVVVFYTEYLCFSFFFFNNEFIVLIEMICIYCKYLNTGKIKRTEEH